MEQTHASKSPQQDGPQQNAPQLNHPQQNIPRASKIPLKRPAEDSNADISVGEALEQLNKSCKRAKASIDAASARDREISNLRRALQTSTNTIAAKDRELSNLRQAYQLQVTAHKVAYGNKYNLEQRWAAKERDWLEKSGALKALIKVRGNEIAKLNNEIAALNNRLALTQRREIEAVRKLDDYKKRMRQMGEDN